jgi:Na+-driven multidrug efflux pump
MRQALSISFHDKTAADRAELRATMSMSGVFDFHQFARADDNEDTSNDTGESTSPGDNSAGLTQSKRLGKTNSCLQSHIPEKLHCVDEEMGPEEPVVEDLTPVYIHEMPEFEVIEEEEWAEEGEEEQDDEFHQKLRAVAGLATPSVVCTLAQFGREVANLYYVAHLGDTRLIVGLGLGNILINTFMAATAGSLSSSMENLVSQALATGKLQACGHHLNRTIIFWALAFLALSPVFVFSKFLLTAVGQDAETSALAQEYLICYLPGLYVWALCDIYRRFFNCFYLTKAPMYCYLATLFIHPVVARFLIVHHGMELPGAAAASLITNGLTYFLLRVSFARQAEMQEASISPSWQTVAGMRSYLEMGLASLPAIGLDLFAWEQMTLANGFIGRTEQTSHIILIYLMSLCCMTGYGM